MICYIKYKINISQQFPFILHQHSGPYRQYSDKIKQKPKKEVTVCG